MITLPDDEKPGTINTFFTKVREELDIIPPVVRVLEIMQEKAIFPANPEQGGPQLVKAAVLPKHPIPKSAVSVAMLAWIIIARFCDALPLYRQEKILDRYSGSITRTTMANWLIRLAWQLQPLINLMMDHLRSDSLINADETRIQVLKETAKSINSDSPCYEKHVEHAGRSTGSTGCRVFHYDPSRSKEVPLRLFEGFSGYLQADGYAACSAVCKQEGITPGANSRMPGKQPGKRNIHQKSSLASMALGKIARLYAIEKVIKDATHDEKSSTGNATAFRFWRRSRPGWM